MYDPRNPYQPYTQNAGDWERQQEAARRAEAEQRGRDNLAAAERLMASMQDMERRQLESMPSHPRRIDRDLPAVPGRTRGGGSSNVSDPGQKHARGARGLAVLGAVVGLLLAAGAGTSVLGGLLVGGLAGALLIPALRLVGWLTVTVLKVAFFAIIVILVLALLGAMVGS